MRGRFEFMLHAISATDVGGGIEPSLALLGALGWELRGITGAPDGGLVIALQRPLDEDLPLPDAPTLAATLDEPLSVPSLSEYGE